MFLAPRLRRNSLKDEGTITLCDALRESKVSKLQELDLSANAIRPLGAKSVAAYVAVNGSLTTVWTSAYNPMPLHLLILPMD